MSSKPELWDIKFSKLEVVSEKLHDYYSRWYRSVGFLWGDISIHPKILEIIAVCKKLWFLSVNVISNGMKFDDPVFARKLVEAGVTRINFSIHSHLPEVEEYLIQVPGGLERKMKAIDNFNALYKEWLLKDAISVNIVLNSKNYKTIVETVLYFYLKKKINDIRVNFIWLNEDTRENWDDLKLSYEEFFQYLKKLVYVSIKYKIRITFDTVPACILYNLDTKNYKTIIRKFLWEDYDHITEIDAVNSGDFFDWKKRKKDTLKTQFDDCEKCIYRNSCQWVRKWYVEKFGWGEFKPITK